MTRCDGESRRRPPISRLDALDGSQCLSDADVSGSARTSMTTSISTAVAERALADLRSGHVTETVVTAVWNSARAFARTKKFTTPNGSWVWSNDDIDDLVGDFLVRPQRIAALADRAGEGPDSVKKFRGALQTSLKNVVIDRYHATPQGVLSRRIERRMKAHPAVTEVAPHHWSLLKYKDEPHWHGNNKLLVAAVSRINIAPPPAWDENSERNPPATTTATVDLACITVLTVAETPVQQETVQLIVVERVLPWDPNVVHESAEDSDRSAVVAAVQLDESTRRAAEAFWHDLSDIDKELLPLLAVPARQVADDGFHGLKKSAIDARQNKLKARLLEFAGLNEDGRAAVHHVLDLNADDVLAGQIGEVSGDDQRG